MRSPVLAVGLSLVAACSAPTGGTDAGVVDAGADAGVEDAGADAGLAAQTLAVIGFGDSVTVGYCASAGHSYVSLLIANDDASYPDFAGRDLRHRFAAVSLKNIAVNGSSSCDHGPATIHQALSTAGLTADRTVVLITLGGNDLIHPYYCQPRECAAFCATVAQATPWAARFKDRVAAQIAALRAEAPGVVTVLLANIYDPTDGVGDIQNAPGPTQLPAWPEGEQVLALYNQTLSQVAQENGATLVDMRSTMLGHGIHWNDSANPHHPANPAYWYCSNLEDPNDVGYQAIRAAFWQALAVAVGFAP